LKNLWIKKKKIAGPAVELCGLVVYGGQLGLRACDALWAGQEKRPYTKTDWASRWVGLKKSEKLSYFFAQYKNRWYGSSIVSGPIPRQPISFLYCLPYFLNNTKIIEKV
jgi:hypothetical protein